MIDDPNAPLPIDWFEWRDQWGTFQAQHGLGHHPRPSTIPASQNFLADELLGYFRCPKGDVELVEVTMPDFTARDGSKIRYVGVTFAPHPDGWSGVVATWAELEQVLGL